MEIETGIAIAGSAVGGAIASKELLIKALGPTAEYFGGELKKLVEKCNINLTDVFGSSVRKGAGDIAGSVNLRVAKAIIDDAAYCDDALLKDYYGGLLCGSKSEDGDDAALSYVSILRGMSRIQVKTHFLIYAHLHRNIVGKFKSITDQAEREKIVVVLTLRRYFSYVGGAFPDEEAVINHVASGLTRAGLIGPFYQYGETDYIASRFPELPVQEPSFVVCPSILGVELFLWASGIKNPNPNHILQPNSDLLSRFSDDIRNSV